MATGPSTSTSTAEQVGRNVGVGFRGVADFSKRHDLQGKAAAAGATAGRKYEEVTHRDSKADSRTAGIIAAAGAAVVVGVQAVISAVPALAMTGALATAGVIGAAQYCKHTGHEKEYQALKATGKSAGQAVANAGRDFAKGVSEGSKHPGR